jgi:phosphoglycerol transferase MdoB-like AlkP superfamily enzyme
LFYFVVLYAILANVPFWTASSLLGLLHNRLFCLEFLAVGFLALFISRISSGVLLFLAIAADLICGISQTYYLSPSECLRSSSFLYLISGKRLLLSGGILVITLLISLAAASFPLARMSKADRWIAAVCLAVFGLTCVSVDFVAELHGIGEMPNPFRLRISADSVKSNYFNRTRLSRLTLIQLARNQIWGHIVRDKVLASEKQSLDFPSASAVALDSAPFSLKKNDVKMPNLVVILVESWGLAIDSSIHEALARPYFQPEILAHYKVSEGTVPFYGPTIDGEARELCNSNIGFHLLDASRGELQGCLPERLSQLGYHTMVLHGMDGHMFDRSTWYDTIGFEEKWFRDEFRKQGLPDCTGAFTGTCDGAIAEWIGHRLAQPDENPDFLYWVTLNSHLPVPIPPPLAVPDSCSISPILSREPAFCSWYQLVSNVHHSVGNLALAKLARPTVFVIVGDHAPGFANPSVRSQFSSEVVPYVVLTPRSYDTPLSLCALKNGCGPASSKLAKPN